MNVSIGTALTSLLAATVTAPRTGLVRPVEEVRPGDRVTASYTVEADGSLALRKVSLNGRDQTEDALARESGQQQLPAREERQSQTAPSLAALSRPKAQISPYEELLLFASNPADGKNSPLPSQVFNQGVSDAQYEVLDANSEAGGRAEILTLAAQRQQQVAGLYARNSDIVYNIEPAYSAAA